MYQPSIVQLIMEYNTFYEKIRDKNHTPYVIEKKTLKLTLISEETKMRFRMKKKI